MSKMRLLWQCQITWRDISERETYINQERFAGGTLRNKKKNKNKLNKTKLVGLDKHKKKKKILGRALVDALVGNNKKSSFLYKKT